MKKILFIVPLAALLFACGKNPEMSSEGISSDLNVREMPEGEAAALSSPAQDAVSRKEVTPAKIRRTANLDLTVEDYAASRAQIQKLVAGADAYIASENEVKGTYQISNTLVIRVNSQAFDGMVSGLSGVASHVNSKNIFAEDVTAQFVDISARLKSKKDVEKRYTELLAKAASVKDILEVEQNLRVIREEIEAQEALLKLLNDQVSYSTINLTIHQDFEFTPQNEPGFLGRIGKAFGQGWKGFLALLVGFVYLWPLWLILGAGTWLLVKFIRRRNRK